MLEVDRNDPMAKRRWGISAFPATSFDLSTAGSTTSTTVLPVVVFEESLVQSHSARFAGPD